MKVFGKKKKGEQTEDAPVEQKSKKVKAGKPKVNKGFGNTIILFIVFFIVFTVIVTGVAFFADKIDFSGNQNKDLAELTESKEKMTDPKEAESTEYTMDEKGNIDKKAMVEEGQKMMEKAPAPAPKPAPIPMAKKTSIPAAKKTPAPLPPVNIKPVIKKPVPKPAPKKKVVKAAPKPTSRLATLSKKMTSGDFVVQLASFKTKKYADAEQRKLKRLIPDVFVVRADLGDKGIWYRLRCFKGVNHDEAKAKAVEIARKTNFKPYPMKK